MPSSPTLRAFVIADDLTGAADAGLPFHSRGLSTRLWLAPDAVGGASEVRVLPSETRNLTEDAAAAALREVGRTLSREIAGANPPPLLFKKIDSTLRGWPGAELRCLLDHLPSHTAWVIPSYPEQGRRMRGGLYTVRGVPLHQTEFAREIPGGITDSRIQPLLERQMGEPVGFVGSDVIDRGPAAIVAEVRRAGRRAVLFDAADEEHLRRVVAAGSETDSAILWVGSAGLAGPLAEQWEGRRFRERAAERPIVIAAGSRNPLTLRQIAYLKERVDLPLLTVPVDGRTPREAEPGGGAPDHRLVTFDAAEPGTPAPGEGDPAYRLALASRLGAAAAEAVARTGSRRLILTGGDIAAAACRHLNVHSLQIVGRVEEAMPVLRLHGGAAAGAAAVTKAGGFGSEASLYNAFRTLIAWDEVS